MGADAGRPPAELLTFDVRDWLEEVSNDDHALRVARARQRHQAACEAWTAATGLSVLRPMHGESWRDYRRRVGPSPTASAAVMKARLIAHIDP
ncbi:hypothetical protein IN07_24140 [Modestobacter caceresii]|uniref:Uncharacterized protein n=1 Tax=Modestobacter caceresii TaxID=1522368 RepID=A0A098Y1N2_9ACTN|nr:hypothetical protein IN07_24140 [Modestobacter caceresii]